LGFGNRAESLLVFTRELTSDKFYLLETIRWSPVIFQQRIDKKADIRVTVVGDQLFSCSIDSQSHPATETDFKMMNISGLLPHNLITLPEKLEKDIMSMMRMLGLTFGCLDFIQTKDDDFYFLEIQSFRAMAVDRTSHWCPDQQRDCERTQFRHLSPGAGHGAVGVAILAKTKSL
jgi:glutathione synthase/RimK-type ligase-like ATP-grasp enzyme